MVLFPSTEDIIKLLDEVYSMTKREICRNSLTIAFSYAFKGFEVKSITHETRNEIYAVSDILTDHEKYHKLRIYTNAKGQYVRLYGRVFYLENLIKL